MTVSNRELVLVVPLKLPFSHKSAQARGWIFLEMEISPELFWRRLMYSYAVIVSKTQPPSMRPGRNRSEARSPDPMHLRTETAKKNSKVFGLVRRSSDRALLN